jgi:hypothetical protein
MIIYSITFAIDSSIEKDWVEYMNASHIPTLMDCGYFTAFQHTRIIPEQGLDLAFNIQLTCKNTAMLEQYIGEQKESHDLELHQKYSGKFASFFTKLEVLI